MPPSNITRWASRNGPPNVSNFSSSRPTTLLPFLYNTPTIRGYRPGTSGPRRPNLPSSFDYGRQPRARPEDDVPFEGDDPLDESKPSWAKNLRPRGPHVRTGRENTTLTNKERYAFQNLLEGAMEQQQQQQTANRQKLKRVGQKDQGDLSDLNAIMEQAAFEFRPPEDEQRTQQAESPDFARRERALLGYFEKKRAEKEGRETEPLSEEEEQAFYTRQDIWRVQQECEYKRIDKRMVESQTDLELWQVLEEELFTMIRALGFQEKQQKEQQAQQQQDQQNKQSPTHQRKLKSGTATLGDLLSSLEYPSPLVIIGPNYPSLLVTAIRHLRLDFPASTLPLSILPSIKALGQESFVLGVSTVLYNELIVILWLRYADFNGINNLLQEMDNGVVDFDENTLDILERIQWQMQKGLEGRYGVTFREVWRTDIFSRGARKLWEWRKTVRERLEKEELRKERLEAANNAANGNGVGLGNQGWFPSNWERAAATV